MSYDPTVKGLVETEPESWPAFLGRPTGPTRVIDSDIATVSGAADKVLRVDAAPPYLIHLEFVAGHDAAVLPRKLHVRNALLEDRHDLPVLSVAVLLRPEADSPRLTGVYHRAFPGEDPYLAFRYHIVRVWQLPAEPLLKGGLALLPLALVSAVTPTELPGIIKRIGQRLNRGAARRYAEQVWASAYLLLGLRYTPELSAELFRGIVTMKESSTYQAILMEGRQEGNKEGAVSEARKLLKVFGGGFFGPPDAKAVAAIERIEDLAQLELLCEKLRTVGSWRELLDDAATASRPRRRRPTS